MISKIVNWDKRKNYQAKKIVVIEKENGCEEIISHHINKHGYGIVGIGKTKLLAHRYSYECNFGEIPEGLCVMHKCDNPSCVNPNHLTLGTHTENMKDMKEKGRRKGTATNIKVNDEIAEKILKDDSGTHKELAKKYGISRSQISTIKRGERKSLQNNGGF